MAESHFFKKPKVILLILVVNIKGFYLVAGQAEAPRRWIVSFATTRWPCLNSRVLSLFWDQKV